MGSGGAGNGQQEVLTPLLPPTPTTLSGGVVSTKSNVRGRWEWVFEGVMYISLEWEKGLSGFHTKFKAVSYAHLGKLPEKQPLLNVETTQLKILKISVNYYIKSKFLVNFQKKLRYTRLDSSLFWKFQKMPFHSSLENRPFAAKPSCDLLFIKLWAATLRMPEMEKACRKHQNGKV